MAPRRKSTRISAVSSTVSSSRVATPDPITHPRPRGRPRKIKPTEDIEIPDSDDIGDVITINTDPKDAFLGVFLPPNGNTTTTGATSTASPSIVDSVDSADYETLDTSAMTTPAVQDQQPDKKRGRVSATVQAKEIQVLSLSASSSISKRKRVQRQFSSVEEARPDEDPDAQLAARLQAEEYGQDDDSDSEPLAKKRRQAAIKSSSNSDLSELSEIDDSDVIPAAAVRRRQKSAVTARKIKQILDSDDEFSELSDLSDTGDDYEEVVVASSSRTKKTRMPIRKKARVMKKSVKAGVKSGKSTRSGSLASLPSDLPSESEFSELPEDEESEDDSDGDDSEEVDTNPARKRVVKADKKRLKPRYGLGRAEWSRLSHSERRAKRERHKLENSHPEIKTMWDDLAKIEPIKPVQAAQPTGISRTLKSFQLEGLDWMIRQEKSHYKGGLLGDEMGMGKTIQAVSLIMSDYPAKRPTLVVVPPVALMQWQSEINAYTSGKLKVLVYHVSANPKCKLLKTADLKKYNVIMVSYSGLESMHRKETRGWSRGDGIIKEDSILHSIKYHRLILDEAHSIKQRTTSVARACFALRSNYKWCLSGTPVQNRIGEFFSLLRFLEVEPFACYFCKDCNCRALHWSQDERKMCNHCHHSGFSHVSVFNQEILNPITSDSVDLRKSGLEKLRLITDRIMLRRLKRDHTSSMELPPKDVILHREFFSEMEKDFSTSIMAKTTRRFDTYVAQGVMLNNYANIFGLIMQMRQIANHPDLLLRRQAEGGQNVLVCCICDEPAEEAIRSRCKHEFCRECAKTYVRSFIDGGHNDADCPQCHLPLEIDWDQPEIEQDEEMVKKNSIINRIKMENWVSSTKIEMLVYDLYKLRSKKQTHKSIVFSQFTSMLQLIQWRLQRSGFSTVLLDGSMSPAQRQKSIDHFMNNVDVEVFLVSLKAGGVALNLTEASRVFIVDPWWNPAAEWQSADRCHRIGQRRPCIITRLCVEDSVESRMVLLQEKKAKMINGTINNDQVALDKLSPEDMQFLFRGA